MSKDELLNWIECYRMDSAKRKDIETAVDAYSKALLQQAHVSGNEVALPPLYAVNRVEVIDEAGRSYVNWHNQNSVHADLQDNARTLKVFITRRQ